VETIKHFGSDGKNATEDLTSPFTFKPGNKPLFRVDYCNDNEVRSWEKKVVNYMSKDAYSPPVAIESQILS